MTPVVKAVSGQTAEVYKLIQQKQTLTVQEIANLLGVLPNGIYRAASRLIELGVVERVSGYPVRFRAVPATTAMNLYLAAAARSLRQDLGITGQKARTNSQPVINLTKDRATSLRQTAADARLAKESIDYIVSGFEVPDETYIAFRKAAMTGVRIRAIVQQKSEVAGGRLEKWQEIGATVRYLPNLKFRLFIFDRRIAYIASYDNQNQQSMFGVRFKYEPLALQMTELFEQNWQKAKEL